MKKKIIPITLIALLIFSIYFSYSTLLSSASIYISVYNGSNDEKERIICSTKDITEQLKYAFELCESNADKNDIYEISVPCGEYEISSSLTLPSNTTLNLSDDVTITNTSKSDNMFVSPSGFYRYNGLHNFSIIGGNFRYASPAINKTTFIRIAHSKNISFQNVNFSESKGGHFAEVAGSKNVFFYNCSFSNLISDNTQALQIDILEENVHFRNMPAYDNTMNDGITVKNCRFTNVAGGVGTYSMFDGYYQKNIKIENNLFTDIKSTAVTCTSFINTKITGNTIMNADYGIYFSMMKTDGQLNKVCQTDNKGEINTNANSVISNNYISCKNNAIKVFGNIITEDKKLKTKSTLNTGDYSVNNIKIYNNTILTEQNGILLYNTKNSVISSNSILTKDASVAIFYNYECENIKIYDNNTLGPFKNGIYSKVLY